jgi:hypothetical protein
LEVGAEGGFKLDLRQDCDPGRQDCDPGRQDRDPGKQKLKGTVRTETYWRIIANMSELCSDNCVRNTKIIFVLFFYFKQIKGEFYMTWEPSKLKTQKDRRGCVSLCWVW